MYSVAFGPHMRPRGWKLQTECPALLLPVQADLLEAWGNRLQFSPGIGSWPCWLWLGVLLNTTSISDHPARERMGKAWSPAGLGTLNHAYLALSKLDLFEFHRK